MRKGTRHTPQAIERMRIAMTGRTYGPPSIETRAKISVALTGRHRPGHSQSPEVRARISSTQKGRIFSAETHARMSEARRKRPSPSNETRDKMRRSMLGKTLSVEARAKIAAWHTGRPLTAESRAKIGAANRGNTYSRDAQVIGECVYCGATATTRDHVIPRGRPGWDDPGNLVPACGPCNKGKKNRTPEEWFAAMVA